ncbi:MAG: glucose-6-phosphate isomerase family protein [Candidatus Kariarchaeaceae archaeon]
MDSIIPPQDKISQALGLGIYLNDSNELEFKTTDIVTVPIPYKISQLDCYNSEWASHNKDSVVFTEYADIKRIDQRAFFASVKFSIYVISSLLLDEELPRTYLFRYTDPQALVDYPHVLQIVWGEGLVYLQRSLDYEPDKISKTYVANVRSGDLFIIPPKYDHLIVNKLPNSSLVFSSLSPQNIPKNFEMSNFKGGAYLFNTSGSIEFNSHYSEIPPLKPISPPSQVFQGLKRGTPIYTTVTSSPESFFDFFDAPNSISYQGLL